MEQEINITLGFKLATGKVNLNEIVYWLKELRDPLMLHVVEEDSYLVRCSHCGEIKLNSCTTNPGHPYLFKGGPFPLPYEKS